MSERVEPIDKPVTLLSDLLSTQTVVKILDFFLVHEGMDYTLKEISENTGSSLMSVFRAMPILEKYQLVRITRKIGKSILYTLNSKSQIVRSLDNLQNAVSSFIYPVPEEIELLGKHKLKEHEELIPA